MPTLGSAAPNWWTTSHVSATASRNKMPHPTRRLECPTKNELTRRCHLTKHVTADNMIVVVGSTKSTDSMGTVTDSDKSARQQCGYRQP